REFATLRSVGMTNKEFNKMIRLESLFIGLKALIFGIPGGLLLSYYMDKKTEYETNFVPPVGTILVTVAAVFILIFVIMNYALSKVKKQNTIETIRNENI
nr:ABC transporter permease [Lachnospiraceae bacterium]